MLTVRTLGEGVAVAGLPKQVDFDNASLVGAQCEDLVRQGCAYLVVDASGVEYLDSSGISMLITLSRILADRSGALRIAGFNVHYRQIWTMLGLDDLLPLSPTVQAALPARVVGA
jgi:anti-sigma B factor antagonist